MIYYYSNVLAKKIATHIIVHLACIAITFTLLSFKGNDINKNSEIKKVLVHAQWNRTNLEKVLSYFKSDKDKYEAACFLIKNMDNCYALSNEDVVHYRKQMFDVFKNNPSWSNDQYRYAYDEACRSIACYPEMCDTLYDSQNISDSLLISNIESAYSMWKKHSNGINFETFCNYILPYRVGHEPLSNWRCSFFERYMPEITVHYSKQNNYYNSIRIYSILNQGFNGAVYYPRGPIPEFALSVLPDVKIASCEEYSARSVAQLRAFGIPATIDFVPQWGNRSMGHSWSVMFVNNTYTLPFGVNEKIGSHFDDRTDLTLPKVYRKTFVKQKWLREISTDMSPYIPTIFKDDRYIDVTDKYAETSDIIIEVEKSQWLKNVKWMYLSVFDDRDWVPVAFSRIRNNKVRFSKIGRGIAYILSYCDAYGSRHYASDPFILDSNGEKQILSADTSSYKTIRVVRKYKESETLWKYCKQLEGGKFVVSNDKDFKDSMIVAAIDTINENRFHTIQLKYQGEYSYFKYISPNGSYGNVAEIELFDDNGKKIIPRYSYGGRGAWIENSPEKAFDGKVLTSYSRMSPDGAWTAVELNMPQHLSKVRIHPRTDGNALYIGNIYQLFYWYNGQWKLIGEQEGKNEDALYFHNVPYNALLRLHNATQGSEERIFTYNMGKQIWW